MNDLKWFRFVAILRYGIDLARIFPIIMNQRGTSRLISWFYSCLQTYQTSWQHLNNLDLQLQKIASSLPALILDPLF
jgi:hypothetical protein